MWWNYRINLNWKSKVNDFKNEISQKIENCESREKNFENRSLKEIKKYASLYAQDPPKNNFGNHQKNTGVYLWLKGYEPVRFLGAGCSGVAWLCKKGGEEIVVKVTCNRKIGPIKI